MIPTEQEECGGIPDLERPQIKDTLQLDQPMGTNLWTAKTYLNTEITSVNVISQEEISCGSRITADLEEFHQVVLAMD